MLNCITLVLFTTIYKMHGTMKTKIKLCLKKQDLQLLKFYSFVRPREHFNEPPYWSVT